jgi:acetylglutamate kinase
MEISNEQLALVNERIAQLLEADSFYGKRLREHGIDHVATPEEFKQYVADGVIQGGMIPKLENSFEALNAGVSEVVITLASAINGNSGTRIRK